MKQIIKRSAEAMEVNFVTCNMITVAGKPCCVSYINSIMSKSCEML